MDKIKFVPRTLRLPEKAIIELKKIKENDTTGKSLNALAVECLLLGLKQKYKIEI
jgi:hypothetical protein